TRIEDVDLVGLDPAELRVPGFRLPTTVYGGMGFAPSEMNPVQRLLVPLMRGALTVRPRVKTRRCIGCGSCRDACPVGAVTLAPDGRRGERARIDDDKCIRCYCCHEMCPQGAIDLRRSLLHRLVKP
ncbi:MAG: 4Fe-4S binding protein, partial [Proteobacteria bacterium]|nr:4Fe-4S binding protein [Pseudomonadota bacterium]